MPRWRAVVLGVVSGVLLCAALIAAQAGPLAAQQPTLPAPLPPTPVCPDTLPTRLIVRERARVDLRDPAPLNIRAEPGTGAEKIGELPTGGLFHVLDGPRCTPLYTWYRIEARVDGQWVRGWVAEGSSSVGYFVEPYPPGR